MAWNEPPNGNNNNDQDPWGNRRRKGNDGPPDLDEIFKQVNEKLNKWLGGGKNKGGGSSGGSGGSGASFGAILGILLVVVLAYAAYDSIYTVDESERAVILRLGEFSTIELPGLHFKVPFIDQIDQKVNVTEVRSYRLQESMLTGDENIVSVTMTVEYRAADAEKFALNVQQPETSLANAAESALRHVIGSATLEQALTVGRDQIQVSVRQRLQNYLNLYDVGIELAQLNINDTSPPQQVQAAFDDVITAREDQQRLINEAQAYANQILPVAQGRARRQLEEAQAYREQVVANATGEADRFTNILGAYSEAPEVTRERLYLESISRIYANTNKVLVDVEGGNNMMYLPLDQLRNNASGSLGSTSSGSGQQVLNPGGSNMNNLSSSEVRNLTDQILREIDRRRTN
ncbi:MAG: FtsH protease activity modulator HflK [Saccharospirillum sp.]|uniref:FtsH protease activity modulator HflK n=1 Tax=Saccharospirillum sp. TaxID=2033801 RepID=UPI003299A6F5